MYYPYLRGKQFELLALRDFAEHVPNNRNVTPIVEPVRKTFKGIQLALPVLHRYEVPVGVVLNPQVGELVGDCDFVLNELKESSKIYRPAFIIYQNATKIRAIIEREGLEDVLLLRHPSAVDPDTEVEKLVSMDAVSTLLIGDKFKGLRRAMGTLKKEAVLWGDYFNPLVKNADYLNVPEEMFTEDFWYYNDEGYNGISDYTVLPSAFAEGGSLPYAIAIHFTYVRDKRMFVRHFVSDSNSDQSNIHGKFEEAAEKAICFFDEEKTDTYGLRLLRGYVERQEYPGLGMLKKISILHHLELVANLINHN